MFDQKTVPKIAEPLMIPMNPLSLSLKQKMTNSSISSFSLGCGILICGVEKSNMKIEIALFLEFNLFIAPLTD